MLTVFEARNQTLKEVYVGTCDYPFGKVKERHILARPKAISHWKFRDQLIVYAEIDHKMPDADAKIFFASYAKMIDVPGFTTITD